MYRKDIVPQAPQTWDQVLADGTSFQNQGQQFYGYAIRGAKGNPIMSDWFPILRAFGGDVFDDHWNVIFGSSDTVNAVKFLVGQLRAVAQPGPDTTDAADRSRLVATGHALQSTVWPAEASDIVENPQVSTMVHKVGYTVMPMGAAGRHTPMMGNWLMGIPQAARQKDWSYRFIAWATSAAVQRPYAAAGGIPSRKSILTDAALNQRYPFFQAMSASLAAPPFWRPRTTEWSAIETILGTHMNAALAGTESPEQAVSRSATEATQHMKEAGYIKLVRERFPAAGRRASGGAPPRTGGLIILRRSLVPYLLVAAPVLFLLTVVVYPMALRGRAEPPVLPDRRVRRTAQLPVRVSGRAPRRIAPRDRAVHRAGDGDRVRPRPRARGRRPADGHAARSAGRSCTCCSSCPW